MGMMFQMGGLFSDKSMFENIAFPIREHTDLPEELLRDLVLMKLDAVGLRGTAKLFPSELSGGMARRVALARAVALDPMLIMYDEPFAGLDPISLAVVGQTIRRLNDALGATSNIRVYRDMLARADSLAATVFADWTHHASVRTICLLNLPEHPDGVFYFGSAVAVRIRRNIPGATFIPQAAQDPVSSDASTRLGYQWNKEERLLQRVAGP